MKKILSVVLTIVLLVCMTVTAPISVNGESSDIYSTSSTSLPSSIYLKQETNYTCTLCSSAMMLRSRMYLSNNTLWSSITESAIKSTAWVDGSGLRWSWTYSIGGNSMSVAHAQASGMSISSLKSLLNSHNEGIVLYCGNIPHAVFVTDYDGDTFYCADPASGYSGTRRVLSSSYLGKVYGSQANILSKVTAYWYVSSYNISGAPVVTDTQPPTLLNVYQDNFSNSGYTLHFTLTDNTALSYVTIYTNIDGNNRKSERINLSGTRQDVSYNVKYSDYGETTGYRHGIWAYDVQGNKCQSPWIEVISDTEIPVISNIYQDNFTDDGYTIHFTITDNNSLKYFKIFSWKEGFAQKIEDINISGKVENVSYRVKYSDFNNEKSGYINAIWAYDTANNRGDSPFIYVETDNRAPEITDVYQDNFNDDGYTLHFTVNDTNWLKYAIIYTNINGANRKEERINLTGKTQEVSYNVKYSDYGTKTGYRQGIWVYDVQGNKCQSPWIVIENEQEKTTTETKPTVTAPITTKPVVNKTTVTLAKYSANLYVKGTTTIKPTVKNGKGVTTYRSNNTRVAKVDSRGRITALRAGTAGITVTNNKVSKVFAVEVLNPKLNKTSVSISRGKSYTLKITGKIGKAKFYTSNKKIATVNSKGKIIVNKKAKRGSTATITVKTNGITLKCKVKVK